MRRRTIALAAAAGALTLALTVAVGAVAGTASNSQTFTDATGEDPAAPDVTTIVTSNDDAGLITFQVNVSNRPALTPDMLFLIFVDSVPGTGDADTFGADYALQLLPEGVGLFKWNGSDYLFADSQAGVAYTYTPAGPVLRVGASALGAPKSINFIVIAASGITFGADGQSNFDNVRVDVAPGFGTFTYEVKTTLVLTAVQVTTSPKPARAGKAFSAAMAVTRNDTGSLVTAGTVTCTARIGSTTLQAKARRVANGIAACSWTLPKTAKGTTVRGTITFTVDGTQLTRPFAAKIG
jgi:hypothetical protein